MKKKIAILLISLTLAIPITACGGDEPDADDPVRPEETTDTSQKEPLEETDNTESSEQVIADNADLENGTNIVPEYEDGTVEKDIQNYSAGIIKETYTGADINEIAINENLGTEEAGDYIILARLTWNVKNSGSTSKEMLEMYSSDFAARIGNDQPSVNEVAIFWTVPYLDDANAKWAYERNGEGMYLSDKMMDSIFNQ